MIKHSKYYYETDRNGYTTDSSINPKMLLSKEELMKEKEPKLNFDWHLDKVAKQITDLLKSKNKAYGNTALNPSNVFSKLDSTEAICARLDDKLARIQNKGINDKTEDTVDDIIGYLLLLKMSMEK
jgi:non-homologous end joining protein Ku